MSGLLLDTGPSPQGWSYYGDAMRCLHLFALKRAGLPENSDPLIRGTMGHVTQGHLNIRWMLQQQKRDPDLYLEPEAALREWCCRHPEGAPFHDRMIEVFRRYLAANPAPRARILAVEVLVIGILGAVDGQWGLWVIAGGEQEPDRWASWHEGMPCPLNLAGRPIVPTPLSMPGHPRHGFSILMTRRLDLIEEVAGGRVDIVDHKHSAAEVGQARIRKYALDGQFAAARCFGEQLYPGRFNAAVINLIGTEAPYKVIKAPLKPTPHRDGLFAGQIYRMAHVIAQLQRDEPDPHRWPMAQHELVCSGRYGDCPAMDVCAFGPAAFPRRS